MFWSINTCKKARKLGFLRKFAPKKPFLPENEPKGPNEPSGTPQDDKNRFHELLGYEKLMIEKFFFELSSIEKKLFRPYHPFGKN